MKQSYGQRGHGHNDDDAEMGILQHRIRIKVINFVNLCVESSALVGRSVQSFDVFKKIIKETFSNRVR